MLIVQLTLFNLLIVLLVTIEPPLLVNLFQTALNVVQTISVQVEQTPLHVQLVSQHLMLVPLQHLLLLLVWLLLQVPTLIQLLSMPLYVLMVIIL